ncbi:unnamed protein product [Haemonchus placei]|uniref:Head-to-tail adaptor n=1 Tax=Haemonchus placei TaxID=6290 RepID=A0A158QRT2_HAEPC|nr:unnamed protein product [Haemonchus placei]
MKFGVERADVLTPIGEQVCAKTTEDYLSESEVITYCCVVAIKTSEDDVETPLGRLAIEWKRTVVDVDGPKIGVVDEKYLQDRWSEYCTIGSTLMSSAVGAVSHNDQWYISGPTSSYRT